MGGHCGWGAGRVVPQQLDGLHRLVGLLEQVLHERVVRLLTVPRAPRAQYPHELGQARQLPRDRHRQMRHVQRGQVIGLERPVDLGPRDLDDDLVGQTQVVKEDCLPGIGVETELDRGEQTL